MKDWKIFWSSDSRSFSPLADAVAANMQLLMNWRKWRNIPRPSGSLKLALSTRWKLYSCKLLLSALLLWKSRSLISIQSSANLSLATTYYESHVGLSAQLTRWRNASLQFQVSKTARNRIQEMRLSFVVSSWLCWSRARKRASSQNLRVNSHMPSNQNGAVDWDKPFSASTFSSLYRAPSGPSSPLMHGLAFPSIQMAAHSNHATSLEPHVHDHAAIVIQCAFRMFRAKSRLNIRSSSVGTPMSWLRRKELIRIPSPTLTPLKKRALVFPMQLLFGRQTIAVLRLPHGDRCAYSSIRASRRNSQM